MTLITEDHDISIECIFLKPAFINVSANPFLYDYGEQILIDSILPIIDIMYYHIHTLIHNIKIACQVAV